MKRIVFILFLMLAAAYVAFGQEQVDSLCSGVTETDTLRDDTIECYHYHCSVQKMHTYELPFAFDGVIDLNGDAQTTYHICLVTGLDSVHFEVCAELSPFAGIMYRIFIKIPADCQLLISGLEGASVTVTAKMDTSTVHHLLPAPFALLDTLCPAMPILEPVKPWKWVYFDPFTLEKVTNLQPNKAYLRRKIWD